MNKELEDKLQDEIDRFVNYEMGPDEEADFIERMKRDETLKEKVFIRQLLVEAGRKKAEANILRHIRPEEHKSTMWFRWAAACACVLLVGLFFWGRTPRFSTQEIWSKTYAFPTWESSRSDGFSSPETARINHHIEQWYAAGKTDSLVLYYQQLAAGGDFSPITDKSKMFFCIAFLQQKETETAHLLAKELQESSCKDIGDWLLLGCLLQEGKRDKAIELALQISQREGLYREEAKQIYKDLSQRKWF